MSQKGNGTRSRAIPVPYKRLMDLCFGRAKPRRLKSTQLNEVLTLDDLCLLSCMVEREFLAGLKKEWHRPGSGFLSTTGYDPHPFDVCLMEKSRGMQNLAVCLPRQRKGENVLVWHDGLETYWKLEERKCKRRLASLSGEMRILDSLEQTNAADYPLMRSAMRRTDLIETLQNTSALEAAHGRVIENLNAPQRQAVATVFDPSFKTGFFAIQGPPGTGKSTVITAMIAVIGSGILVSAPSNAAVASVAVKSFLRLRDEMGLLDFVVFGGNCDPAAHFLSPSFRYQRFAKFIVEYDAATSGERAATLKSDFTRWLHLDESTEYTVQQLRQLCPRIDLKTPEGRRHLSELLRRAKVVFSTLNSAGSAMLRESLKVHTLLLDEAGQSPEAEFYVGTTVPGVRRIIVVGDPKQLPSTVIDPACQNAGYGMSWLAKVHKLFPQKVHLLSIQYRMDPTILEFPNASFYGGQIKTASSVLGRKRADRPFSFVDTGGHGVETALSFSWSNPFEIHIIQQLLASDPDIKQVQRDLIDQGIKPRLIVMSPYKAQVALLKDNLQGLDGCRLDIATVDSFQGQEAHIVIYSTVRTRRAGFTDSPERINVALTRCISVLRVVGDLSFFLSLDPPSTLRNLAVFASSPVVNGVLVASPQHDVLDKPGLSTTIELTMVATSVSLTSSEGRSQIAVTSGKSPKSFKAHTDSAANQKKQASALSLSNAKARTKKAKKKKQDWSKSRVTVS